MLCHLLWALVIGITPILVLGDLEPTWPHFGQPASGHFA